MTIEELEAVVSDLQAEKEAMQAKNKEILSELKKAKAKSGEFDMDKFLEVQEKLESVQSENDKLSKELKLKSVDSEKLLAQLSQKDGALSNLLIENGLVSALTEAGVKPELMKYVKDSLKSQTKLIDDNGEFKAMIGDKSLNDFVTEWKSGEGQHVIAAPQNSGGGSQGTSQSGSASVDTSKMSAVEMMKAGRKG